MRALPLIVLPCVLLASCSTLVYQRDFQQAVAAAPKPHADPTGPWKGEWLSKQNGHTGPLWCMVSPTPGKPDSYDFRYHAGWGKLEFGDFTHPVPGAITPENTLKVHGDMKLAGFVGTYTVNGVAAKNTFKAAYRSDQGDHGSMTLARP